MHHIVVERATAVPECRLEQQAHARVTFEPAGLDGVLGAHFDLWRDVGHGRLHHRLLPQ